MEPDMDSVTLYLREKIGQQELTDDIRREAAECGPQPAGGRLYYRSLTRDPHAPDVFYLAADLDRPGLLRCSPQHVQVLPFAPTDREAVRNFAERIDTAFLPRPQRDQPAVAVGNRHPEISLPAA